MESVHRGDMYFVNIPQELASDGVECYEHMHVVVSRDEVNSLGRIAIVVPLTSPLNKAGAPKNTGVFRDSRIKIPEDQKIWDVDAPHRQSGDSLAKTEQMFCISQVDLTREKRCGTITETAMNSLESGLCFVLNLPPVSRVAAMLAAGPGKALRPPVNLQKDKK